MLPPELLLQKVFKCQHQPLLRCDPLAVRRRNLHCKTLRFSSWALFLLGPQKQLFCAYESCRTHCVLAGQTQSSLLVRQRAAHPISSTGDFFSASTTSTAFRCCTVCVRIVCCVRNLLQHPTKLTRFAAVCVICALQAAAPLLLPTRRLNNHHAYVSACCCAFLAGCGAAASAAASAAAARGSSAVSTSAAAVSACSAPFVDSCALTSFEMTKWP